MTIQRNKSIVFVTFICFLLITARAYGETWMTEVVDSAGSVGEHSSMSLDAQGKAHISYYDATSLDLKYATNATGSWVITTVESAGSVGKYTSISLDSSGNVHISYVDETSQELKYATNATGSWVTTTVDNGSAFDTSIALDTMGKVHISYRFSGLKYATNATGSWVIETLDSTSGSYTSIALDASDKVHISYNDFGNGFLKYATNATGSWELMTVDDGGLVGSHTSIALDNSGKVHISYSGGDFSTDTIKYASNSSGVWVLETVDVIEERGGDFTSIGIDSSGKIHISYYSNRHQELKYATNASGSWIQTIVDNSVRVDDIFVALNTSLALDASDNVHISFYHATNQDLKYATTQSAATTSPPVPNIDVNGSNGPVTPTGNISVTLDFNPGNRSGEDADWWAAANVSGTSSIDGWYYFDLSTSQFVPVGDSPSNLRVTHQGALFNLPSFEILDIPVSVLPSGTYTFYLAVDMKRNGVLDFNELFFDSVIVNISP